MRTRWRCRVAALVMLALAAGSLGAEEPGGRARNKRLFIVPPPGPVKINGRLDDWDLSGQIEIVVTRETAATQSARIAAMYDAEAIYLSGEFRDPSPMMNKHDPRVNAEKAWDADAFQFRLVLDPKLGFPIHEGSLDNPKPNPAICHMLLWYYSDRKEPCLHLQYGMTYSPPKAGYLDSHLVAEGKATHRERTTDRNGIDLGPDKGNCTVSIDDLRIYGRGLTGEEVRTISNSR